MIERDKNPREVCVYNVSKLRYSLRILPINPLGVRVKRELVYH